MRALSCSSHDLIPCWERRALHALRPSRPRRSPQPSRRLRSAATSRPASPPAPSRRLTPPPPPQLHHRLRPHRPHQPHRRRRRPVEPRPLRHQPPDQPAPDDHPRRHRRRFSPLLQRLHDFQRARRANSDICSRHQTPGSTVETAQRRRQRHRRRSPGRAVHGRISRPPRRRRTAAYHRRHLPPHRRHPFHRRRRDPRRRRRGRGREVHPAGEFVFSLGSEVDQSTAADLCTAASHHTCQPGSLGTAPGSFTTPSLLAVDPTDGDFYVADSGDNTVSKYDSSGSLLTGWGSGGALAFAALPQGVAVDSDRRSLRPRRKPDPPLHLCRLCRRRPL